MTEIGSVNQSFNVLRKEIHSSKNHQAAARFEENFGEVFSRVASKNFQQAVIPKSQVKSGELANYVAVSFRPKNRKSQEVENEILEKMLKKVKRLAVEWVQKRKGGEK